MEFDQKISRLLDPLFTDHGLKMIEVTENTVRYESEKLHISIVHNPRENSNTLWIGRKGQIAVEIDNDVMLNFFNSDLELSNLPLEIFLSNVILFFKQHGSKMMGENSFVLDSLVIFNKSRSSKYTKNLTDKSYLEAADKAWKDKNYEDVIKNLDMVKNTRIPSSLKQKYKLAHMRLNNLKS